MTEPTVPTPPVPTTPTRWAAAGFLGGASLVGMLWAIIGRAPAMIPGTGVDVPPPPAAASIAQPISSVTFPTNPPPAKIIVVQAEPRTATPNPGDRTPEPGGAAVALPTADRPGAPLPASKKTPAPATPSAATVRLNINTASSAELELLPRIGPTLAGRIIEYRARHGPIRSLRQLTEVKGIGARTVERLEPYIRFE